MLGDLMNASSLTTALFIAVIAAVANAGTTAQDPLTKLPIAPAAISSMVPTAPTRLPDMPWCGSNMATDFYTTFADEAMETTVAWYASNLKGFKHVHGYVNGHARDSFYNADGTVVVALTAYPKNEGVRANTRAIVYLSLNPGLREKIIVAMNMENTDCR
jgi:hypothetical protein